MKISRVVLIMFCLINTFLYSQITPVTPVGLRDFSINRFDKIVYAKDYYTTFVNEYNLTTGESKTTQFPNLPILANKVRKAVYETNKQLYLYDYAKDSTYLLWPSINNNPYLSFSPNDKGLLVGGNDTLKYYLFNNNKIKLMFSILGYYTPKPAWLNDSTIVIVKAQGLISINMISGKRDTVLSLPNDAVRGMAYNPTQNIIAYSKGRNPYAQLRLLDLKTKRDSLVFSFQRDMPNLACVQGQIIVLDNLAWSIDGSKLLFFNTFLTNSIAGVFAYHLDKDSTVLLSACGDYGLKYFPEWINNDTVIFSNSTASRVYSISVPKIITSIFRDTNTDFKNISFRNFPNPFNNSTNLEFSAAEFGEIEIEIFNILGESVVKQTFGRKGIGKHSYIWNGKNKNGNYVNSGVYISVLRFTNDLNKTHIKTTKLQLIK